jgi:hypothetical protein
MFEITGKIKSDASGKTYRLKYEYLGDYETNKDYIVSGDDVAVKKFFAESKNDHGRLGLSPDVWSLANGYAEDELSASGLARRFVFDERADYINDWKYDPNTVY